MGLRVRVKGICVGFGVRKANQMDKNGENQLETGIMHGIEVTEVQCVSRRAVSAREEWRTKWEVI